MSNLPPSKYKNLTGERFGRLKVINLAGFEENTRHKRARWTCVCDCGKKLVVRGSSLLSGNTRSCGCFRGQNKKYLQPISFVIIDGKKEKPKIYATWRRVIERCTYSGNSSWLDYGGRGITVCDRWRNSFQAFCEDMGDPPSDKHSIDRIDPNGNYEPTNCRWANSFEQARNKRNNVKLTFLGETRLLVEWAEILGISQKTLYQRLKYGWTVERVLTTPVK